MLELLRDRVLKDLEKLNFKLSEDVEQRRNYLRSPNKDITHRPKFDHLYNVRRPGMYHDQDVRVDMKLANTNFDRQELTKDAKKEIRDLKREMELIIDIELANLNEVFNEQFETNPQFLKFTEEEKTDVIRRHKEECLKLADRIRYRYDLDIEAVRSAPRSRIVVTRPIVDKKVSKNDEDLRDDLAFSASVVAYEMSQKEGFEKTLARNVANVRTYTSEQQARHREEHYRDVNKECSRRRRNYDLDKQISAKMKAGDELEGDERIDLKQREAMLAAYNKRVELAGEYMRSYPWDVARRLVYDHYLSSSDWKEFIEHAMEIWLSIVLPKDTTEEAKRVDWNSMMVRYANLSLVGNDEKVDEDDLPFHRQLEKLRNERNVLVRRVLELDDVIREMLIDLRSAAKKRKLEVIKAIKKPTPNMNYTSLTPVLLDVDKNLEKTMEGGSTGKKLRILWREDEKK